MFCETPQLMKMVHQQGYPDELLPVTVYGIPSIHVALEFLPELLSQAQPERLVFAIKLAGHLIEKYTLPKWYP
jgi:integrator complex subunit 2